MARPEQCSVLCFLFKRFYAFAVFHVCLTTYSSLRDTGVLQIIREPLVMEKKSAVNSHQSRGSRKIIRACKKKSTCACAPNCHIHH